MNDNVVQLRLHPFRQGDCVRLKSGGPLMLVGVAFPDLSDVCSCLWMGGPEGRSVKSGEYRAAALDLVARGDQ